MMPIQSIFRNKVALIAATVAAIGLACAAIFIPPLRKSPQPQNLASDQYLIDSLNEMALRTEESRLKEELSQIEGLLAVYDERSYTANTMTINIQEELREGMRVYTPNTKVINVEEQLREQERAIRERLQVLEQDLAPHTNEDPSPGSQSHRMRNTSESSLKFLDQLNQRVRG